MSTQTPTPPSESGAAVAERVLIQGDLSRLPEQDRILYYGQVCASLGLNPLTRPFEFIVLNGKLTLYAKRDCTDQLRRRDKISVTITARERMDDVYVVTARASTPDGRTDESIGAVNIAGLKGEALANGMMKAETKSKRRVSLSICGLGWLDETEVDSIPTAAPPSPPRALPREPGVDDDEAEAEPRITPVQREAIVVLMGECQVSEGSINATVKHDFGKENMNQLTQAEAQKIIAKLEKKPRKPRPTSPPATSQTPLAPAAK